MKNYVLICLAVTFTQNFSIPGYLRTNNFIFLRLYEKDWSHHRRYSLPAGRQRR